MQANRKSEIRPISIMRKAWLTVTFRTRSLTDSSLGICWTALKLTRGSQIGSEEPSINTAKVEITKPRVN